MRKKRILVSLIVILMISSSSKFLVNSFVYHEPIAKISIKTNGGGIRPDYALYIADYLKDIGIEVSLKIEEWTVFWGVLLETHNYDLGLIKAVKSFGPWPTPPSPDDLFTLSGSLNIFGIDTDIPYVNQSNQLLEEIHNTVDFELKKTLYYEYQQLVMDKIIPYLPLFSPKYYQAVWSNTKGYNAEWGIVDSLPYMRYDGLHTGQEDIKEFNIADANWKDLNPLFSDDGSSSFVTSLLLEPIIQISPGFAPLKTGLVYEWEQIDETHYQFWMMDDVYWNPSYDTTDRDANSGPLTSEDLLVGLKDGLPSTGSSHQVTAHDAVFTYLAWASNITSESTSYHEWMSDCYVDPGDDLSFHIHIDGDPDTPEAEPYADMWASISRPWFVLPEFFLNSTNPYVWGTMGGIQTTGLYPGIELTPQWVAYSTSAFGCGKYSLDYSIKNSITVLKRWDGWYGKGAIDGKLGLKPFIDTFNIKVIPDLSAELEEFKKGRIDLTNALNLLPFERKQIQSDCRFEVQGLLQQEQEILFFNFRRPFIGAENNRIYYDVPGKEEYNLGVGVRKAICYGIDREEMNTKLHDGEYSISHSVVYPKTSYYYYDNIIKYDYDLDKSLEWFEASGYHIPECPRDFLPEIFYPVLFGSIGFLILLPVIIILIRKIIVKL
ncbi:MAG: hypothetical protein GPJ51_12005 [Candidatus Heimdallarchaeota archaeon]|nr:hypothetical protein [Candidatus Heimdallarchaeota archaeon]